ncbi:MAG: hypothetical protein J7J76_00650 [Candidatus Latescibacteria bacterium]|nr:hypothetical protein [Candidatus Latescibacterota bacterium]
MKMVWIAYNQAIGDEVNESLKRCGVTNYTKIPVAHGVGEHSGPHMNSHIWPGVNSLLMIACTEETKERLLEEVRKLRRSFEREGIKSFVTPLEEMV